MTEKKKVVRILDFPESWGWRVVAMIWTVVLILAIIVLKQTADERRKAYEEGQGRPREKRNYQFMGGPPEQDNRK